MCTCHYDKYNSKKLYSTVLCVWKLSCVSMTGTLKHVHDISDHWDMRHIKTYRMGVGMCSKLSYLMRWVLQKPSLHKIAYSKPSKMIQIWTCHIYVVVHLTNIIVKSYTVLHMYLEAIICQSERFLEMFMISQTHSRGGISEHMKWEQEYGGNSPSFWGEFYKTLLTQNQIFLTFQNCRMLNLPHLCICQCNKYHVLRNSEYSTVHVYGNNICESGTSPET